MKIEDKLTRIFLGLFTLYLSVALLYSSLGDNRFEHLHIALDASNGIMSMLFAIFLWTTVPQAHASLVRPYIAIAFAFAAGTEVIHALMGIEWVGDFAWITESTLKFRPATWPPSTYVLPIALVWVLRMEKNGKLPSLETFFFGLLALSAALFYVFLHTKSYLSIGFLGIQRPFQLPVLLILLFVAAGFWKLRKNDPLYQPLVYCLVFLCVSDSFMLYSTSPHEKWTMAAHTGKLYGYLFMHFALIDLAVTDIVARKKAEQEVLSLAYYDYLTGLPNRILLEDRLRQSVLHSQRRSNSLAVGFIDLDGFKAVNDNHGHGVGDELLRVLSERMKAVLREGDTLARFGGDEFVVVLADLDQGEDCQPVLNRLLQVVTEPVRVGEAELNVSSSIGVTLYPQDDADADLLIRHADQAMYKAKQSGKNRCCFFNAQERIAA